MTVSYILKTTHFLLVTVPIWQPAAQDQLSRRSHLVHAAKGRVVRCALDDFRVGAGFFGDFDQGIGEGVQGVLVLR
jgi:hypothetical protein